MNNKENSLKIMNTGLQNTINRSKLHVVGVRDREENEIGAEKYVKKLYLKFPEFVKNINLQIQEAQ